MTNLFLHLGNILYLLAYSVRDILWLRVLTVVATLCLIKYYFCCNETPLYAPIAWSSLFTFVNVVQIAILIVERKPVFMGEEELELYKTVFRTLKPREFIKLLSIAEWKRAQRGEELLQQDEPVRNLVLLSSGQGIVEVDGRPVAEVGAGQFVGEMGFLTDRSASARVVTSMPTDYLCWPVDKLRALLNATPHLHLKVQGVLGTDVVEKLRREGFSAAHPSKVMSMHRRAAAEP